MNEKILNRIARWGLTLLVIFVLFLFSSVPLEFFNLGEIRPAFMLIAVYYMTILRPSIISPLLIFLIGIALDLISSFPLGLNAFILVSVQWLVRGQRKFLLSQSFKIIWASFFLIASASGIIQWLALSLFNFSLYSIKPVLFSALLSSFLFPLIALPLYYIHKSLIDE